MYRVIRSRYQGGVHTCNVKSDTKRNDVSSVVFEIILKWEIRLSAHRRYDSTAKRPPVGHLVVLRQESMALRALRGRLHLVRGEARYTWRRRQEILNIVVLQILQIKILKL